jgi:hypothetical protein
LSSVGGAFQSAGCFCATLTVKGQTDEAPVYKKFHKNCTCDQYGTGILEEFTGRLHELYDNP